MCDLLASFTLRALVGGRVPTAIITGLVCAGSAGCGGAANMSTRSTSAAVAVTPTSTNAGAGPSLPAAIGLRCSPGPFGAPAVAQVGPGWRLVFHYPPRAPVLPGRHATVVSLDERLPHSPRVPYPKTALRLHVAGRRVDVIVQKQSRVAQWVGRRARYVVVTNGTDLATIRRFARCTR